MKITAKNAFGVILTGLFTYLTPAYSQQVKNTYANIPSLTELSGVWLNTDTMAMEPSLRNFRGTALLNRDMTSVSWFASAPYSGGYHTGIIRVNGKAPRAQLFRWYPWQSLRKTVTPTYKIASTVRMVPDNDVIMWEITISNPTKKTQHYNIEQDLIGFISRYPKDQWPWPYPFPSLKGKTTDRTDEMLNVTTNIGLEKKDFKIAISPGPDNKIDSSKKNKITWPTDNEILECKKYHIISHTGNQLVIGDTETDALTGFSLIDAPDRIITKNSGGTACWSLNLKPGANKKIRFFMTYVASKGEITAKLNKWSNSFPQTFAGVELTWEARWKEMFTPHNKLFSGCFPVLATKDKAIRKIYYEGPLTLLNLLNTNLPVYKRVLLTGGPHWGATVTFLWDATEWSEILALVDPEIMKEQMRSFMKIDIDKYFAQDNYSGDGVGYRYVTSYWALFQLIRSYITITKDYDFLNEVVDGKKVIDHLYDYANNWKKLSIYGQPGDTNDAYHLADFGSNPWNLLECVPTYIHIAPGFNAGYVWMMRETAKFYQHLNEPAKAAALNTDADIMVQRLLKLYAGDGTWYTLFPNGKKVNVRTVLDFMYFGKYLNKDLTPKIRKGMFNFAENELITDTWMRALSLKDSAAGNSDRPDHGPMGSYDGWPAGTIDALTQMGYSDKALQFYKSVLPVTYEGAWSQAHEFWGPDKLNKHAKVRITSGWGWSCRDECVGIEFSQVVLKCFMGFYPDIKGNALQPTQKIDFSGSMYHVLYGGKYYSVTYNHGKTSMTAE